MTELPDDLDRLLHDLRGPLNTIHMHVELLKRLDDGAAVVASLETIGREVSRLAVLLPAAFDVVALERGAVGVHDLRTVVAVALEEHGVVGVSVTGGAWPRVRGDARLLGLAVVHLARNALAATASDGPPPEIAADRTPAGEAVVVVRDRGRGLPTTSPRALIRLAMGPSGRPGVGLVTVERIARLHGGRLEFCTPPGGGAEARLTLLSA